MSRIRWGTSALILLLLAPAPAAAARFEDLAGHFSIGYAKLVIVKASENSNSAEAPGGSISMAAGLDYPVAPTLRVGLDLGYDLLGSRTVQEGSYFASVDYSAFQAAVLLHWLPDRLGPVRRVSLGPALVNAHGDLSVTSGGAGFSDLAVRETAGGTAARVTLMQRRPSAVRLGLELGGTMAFLPGDDWLLLGARVAVHY